MSDSANRDRTMPERTTDLLPQDSNERLGELVRLCLGHAAPIASSGPLQVWVDSFPLSAIGDARVCQDSAEIRAKSVASDPPTRAGEHALAVVPLKDLDGSPLEDARNPDFGLALCVAASVPRVWTVSDLTMLGMIASMAAIELQLRTDLAAYEGSVDKLRKDPLHDPVTELANRALFLDRVGQALLRCARSHERHMAVLSVRVNQQESIASGFGYDAAQEVLRECANRMRIAVRSVDSVARLSGDEFGILLESLRGDADSARVATRIHEAFRQPVRTTWDEFMVSVSVGVVLSTTGLDSPARLIQLAGLARERAKGTGAAYELFDPDMQRRAQTRLQYETELRRGVEAAEFELHYQPIIALDSGRIVELEALLRWRHPKRGLIAAGEFIAVAEQTGLIVPMGWLVLTEACEQIRRWRAQGNSPHQLSVSINMTAAHLRHRELLERMRAALHQAGLRDHALNFEITEGILIDDPESARNALNDLRALGVGIRLDDFGTGYSSLQYLHELPLDAIKIDRRFIARLGRESREGQVAATIRELARTLGVPVIAEGVETAEQLAMVRALECEYAQGYFFSHPLPPGQVSELVQANPQW